MYVHVYRKVLAYPPALCVTILFRSSPTIMSGDQKRQLQRLFLIQPRIAITGIICAQVLVPQPLAAPDTLRHRLPRQFQVHATQKPAVLFVYPQRATDFAQDAAELPRFDPRGCGARIAVHGIALPDDDVAAILHSKDVPGEVLVD